MSESLLNAEEAVQDLLSRLQVLKSQMEGYSTARDSLRDTGQALNELVKDIQGLVTGTLEATITLKKIGTPEIMARVAELATGIQDVVQTVRNTTNAVEDQYRNQDKKLDDIQSKLESVEAGHSALSEMMAALQNDLNKARGEHKEHLYLIQAGIKTLNEQEKQIGLLKILIIVGLALSAIVAVKVFL